MSSSSFCQGLRSCLEPCFKEPRVLWLNLAQSKSIFSGSDSLPNSSCCIPSDTLKNESQTDDNNTYIPADTNSHDCDVKSEETVDLGGWSFLQCINNASSNPETDKVYVHPLVKLSASSLSSKSLEMCTESLCSETGSDQMTENGDDISICLPEADPEMCIPKEEPPKLPQSLSFMTKRTSRRFSFPPPLTSVAGFQVRPHREGGRLILEAVTVPPSRSYFHTERRGGRLRLCLMRDCSDELDEEEEEDEFDEEEFEGVDDEEDQHYLTYDNEEVEEAEMCEDIEGNNKKIKDENGGENLRRPSGCKEGERGNKGLLTWEPCWVAS